MRLNALAEKRDLNCLPVDGNSSEPDCLSCLAMLSTPILLYFLPLPNSNLRLPVVIIGTYIVLDWQGRRVLTPEARLTPTQEGQAFQYQLLLPRRLQARSATAYLFLRETPHLDEKGSTLTASTRMFAVQHWNENDFDAQAQTLNLDWAGIPSMPAIRKRRSVDVSTYFYGYVYSEWIVVLRVALRSGRELLHGFNLTRETKLTAYVKEQTADESPRFDLYLLPKEIKSSQRMVLAIQNLLPYLNKASVVELLKEKEEILLLESLSRPQADVAIERLRAHGVPAEIRSTPSEFVRDAPYEF